MTSTKRTRPVDAHRAGRLLLAVADDNQTKITEVLTEASADRASVLGLLLELSAIAIGLADQRYGDQWRDVLGAALVDLELTHDQPNGQPPCQN